MAKQRFVNTKFWSDQFVEELSPLERYLFLYFLTNEHTNICGIYELTFRTIAFETKLPPKTLKEIVKRLQGKVYYVDGWVYVKNFERHQYARGNSKVLIGIENAKKEIPTEILKKIAEIKDEPIPLRTTTKGTSTLDSDLDSDSDLDTDADVAAKLLKKWKQNPLWGKIIEKYPDRDYELCFYEMCDWYKVKKKRLPMNISAFSNWLSRTKPDPAIQGRRLKEIQRQQTQEMIEKAKQIPQARPETLEELKKTAYKAIGKAIP